MLKYVSTDNLKDIVGGYMKRSIVLCILTLMLTGCHDNETKTAQTVKHQPESTHHTDKPATEKQPILKDSIKPKQNDSQHISRIKKEISTEVAARLPDVQPVASKHEYINTVKEYSREMDQLIDSMTVYNQPKDVEQQINKIKNIVVNYETKVQSVKSHPEIKPIDTEVSKANDQYIKSFSKITSALASQDEALKKDGYHEFSKGHTYLDRANFQVQAIENVTTETNVQSTSEVPTKEKPLEIVVYSADGTKEIPVEEQATTETKS